MKKLLLALLFLLVLPNLYADELTARITHIDSTGFPEIEALIRVYDKTVFDLNEMNLKLYEDDKLIATFTIKPQQFNHYMTLVIDRSSSIEDSMIKVKKAAAGFVKSLIEEVSFSIVSFGSDIDFNHDFSRDENSLIEALRKIRPWGGTALYDAIYDSCEDLQAKAGLNDLKTVLCITDGKDSTPSGQTQLSIKSADEVIKFAVDKSIRVITLGLGSDIDGSFLGRIASETGGWYLQTATADELAALCQTMSERLKRRKHYQLKFKTLDPSITSNARILKAVIIANDNEATSRRSYHAPNGLVAGERKPTSEETQTSLQELLNDLEIEQQYLPSLKGNVNIPHPEPVYGLTLASFERANRAESRILINDSREQVARKHQSNLDAQQNQINQHIKVIDSFLEKSYRKVDASGLSAIERARLETFIKYLQLRREKLVLLSQQAYEIYMVNLKSSLEELNYYDRTQVMGETTSSNFFDLNAGAKAEALASVKEKYARLIARNTEKSSQLFSAEDKEMVKEKTRGPDLSLPELPDIKALD
jgi:hypothetical protein